MPRPGPRPYECMRRAWHSDTHQPLRGSIIQQIFRFVHGNHNCSTKKNREWQEKLPLLVFKTEEIMYSKANSEAEYLDSQTLWERINDAIDTIIKRDQSSETETANLLPPCVEAALNLGCVPVRASRSQLNSYPTISNLSPIIHEQQQEEHDVSLQKQLKHPMKILQASTSKQLYPIHPNPVEDSRSKGGFGCDLTLRLGSSSSTTTFGIDINSVIPTEEATVSWRKRKASVLTQEWHQRKNPGPK